MKIESKERAVKALKDNESCLRVARCQANASLCRDVIAWLESTPTTTGWVESKDTGNPVPRVCMWTNGSTCLTRVATDRRQFGNDRETHHIPLPPLPPLPEKPKPPTIGERVAEAMRSGLAAPGAVAEFVDRIIAENREGRK